MQATEAQRRVERLEALLERVRRNRQRSGSDARPGTVEGDGPATKGVSTPRRGEVAPAAAPDVAAQAPSPSPSGQVAADVVEARGPTTPAQEVPAAAAIPAPSQVRGASRPPAEERAPRHTPTPLERVVAESVEPPPSPTPPADEPPSAEAAPAPEPEPEPVAEQASDAPEVHLEVEAPAAAAVPSEAPTGKVAAARGPQPIEPVPPAEPRGAVATVTRAASPVRALTFGELLDRSLSLRPR